MRLRTRSTQWVVGSLLFFLAILSGCQSATSQMTEKRPDSQAAMTASKPKGTMMATTTAKAGFNAPTAITFDPAGNMYVANWNDGTVSRVDSTDNRKTFASIVGSPAGLAFDKQGNLYVSDYRENIYRVSPDGATTIFAAGLHTPTGIAFNKNGELLVTNRSSNELVKVSPTGNVSVLERGLRTPVGVVEHPDGTLYVSNYGGGITKISPGGSATTIGANFVTPGCGIIIFHGDVLVVDYGQGTIKNLGTDGTQLSVVAQNLKQPVALGVHPQGKLYVGTWGDGSVHLVD